MKTPYLHPTLKECEDAGKGPTYVPGQRFTEGGLPNTPDERQRFEAYMKGHCWYVGNYDEEQGCYDTTFVRCLYGIWRDRGYLAEQQGKKDLRRLDIAMMEWNYWKEYALELHEKLQKYEPGSPMILNLNSTEEKQNAI